MKILKIILNNLIVRKILFILSLISIYYIQHYIYEPQYSITFGIKSYSVYSNKWFIFWFLALTPFIGRFNKRKIISFVFITLFVLITPYFLTKYQIIPFKLSYDLSMTIMNIYFTLVMGFLIFLPSVYEVMKLKKAYKAVLFDVLLFASLVFFYPYNSYILVFLFAGIRLWSVLFGIYVPIRKMWGSGIGRAITSLVVSIYMVFYISNPSIYYTDSFLNLIIGVFLILPTIIIFYRITKYLRLILPNILQTLLDSIFFIPGVVAIPILIILKLFAIFGGDFSGFDGDDFGGGDFGGEDFGGEDFGGDDISGEPIDINNDGIVDGYDIDGDGKIDTNILGVDLGPLQSISAHVRSDGTFVNSYLRTLPDESLINNLRPKI